MGTRTPPGATSSGPGRLPQQRRLTILAKLNEQAVVRVKDLAVDLQTSEMTIRRDLAALDADGLLQQVHGGAVPVPRQAHKSIPSDASQAVARDGHVGIILPDVDYYFGEHIAGCREVLSAQRLAVSAISSQFSLDHERELAEQFRDTGAKAVIYAPSYVHADDLTSWLFDLTIPVVLIERELTEPATGRSISSVRTAYEKGWETSLRYLRQLGHQRVALVTHGLRQVGVDLTALWSRAAARAGFADRDAPLLLDHRVTLQPDIGVLEELSDRIEHAGVTGIISHSDRATLAIVHTLRTRGWRIPEDLSVVTNEDMVAEMTDPPLTSNSPAKRLLGRTAARMALEAVTDPLTPTQHVVIEPAFTERHSCAAPPSRFHRRTSRSRSGAR